MPGLNAAHHILENLTADIFSDSDWLVWLQEHLLPEAIPSAVDIYNPMANLDHTANEQRSGRSLCTSSGHQDKMEEWKRGFDGIHSATTTHLESICTPSPLSQPDYAQSRHKTVGDHAGPLRAPTENQVHSSHAFSTYQGHVENLNSSTGHALEVAHGHEQADSACSTELQKTGISSESAASKRMPRPHVKTRCQIDDLGIPSAKQAWLQCSMRMPHVAIFAESALQRLVFSIVQKWAEEGWKETAAGSRN
jgi:hypothetical protein